MENRKKFLLITAIIAFCICQLLNFWAHQDLIEHYLECRQQNTELRLKVLELDQEIYELHKDIQEPLEKIYNLLNDFEVQ